MAKPVKPQVVRQTVTKPDTVNNFGVAMGNKDNFVSKNRDAINAIGHTLNTLQNAKIRKNQESIVRLAAVNAKLQQENVRVNEEILEAQKRHLEDKKREEKQNVVIKKLMLKIGPELEDLTNELTEKGINDDTYQEYLDAKIMIGFISNYRELIEDINYQRLIREQEKKINSFSDQLDTNSNSFKEIVFQILQDNVEVLHSLNALYEINQNNLDIETESLEEAIRILSDLYGDPIKTTIISESLKQIEKKNIKLEDVALEESFIKFSLNTTDRINDFQFFQKEVVKKIETYKLETSKYSKEELLNYLRKSSDLTIAIKKSVNSKNYTNIEFKKVVTLCDKALQFDEENGMIDYGVIKYLDGYIFVISSLIYSIEDLQGETQFNQEKIIAFVKKLESKTQLGINPSNVSDKIGYLKKEISRIGKKFPEEDHFNFRQVHDHFQKQKCFVVTATTGSSDNRIVNDFRNFRDEELINYFFGRVFISVYYKVGPYLAKLIHKNENFRKLILEYFINPIHNKIK